MLRTKSFGIAKVLFALAITAVGVTAVQTLNSNAATPPKGKCPCQCPYYTMCSGPPNCLCVFMGDY